MLFVGGGLLVTQWNKKRKLISEKAQTPATEIKSHLYHATKANNLGIILYLRFFLGFFE